VEAITNFPKSQDVKDLRRFLGIINFYHKFLPNIANIRALLQKVIKGQKKNSQIPVGSDWTTEKKATFKKLKHEVANVTLLALPDPSVHFAVQSDAYSFAIEAALQQ